MHNGQTFKSDKKNEKVTECKHVKHIAISDKFTVETK